VDLVVDGDLQCCAMAEEHAHHLCFSSSEQVNNSGTLSARTHLQQLLTVTAMNVVRVIAWLKDEPLGERRRKPGHFARLAPHPLSRQTVLA